MHRFFYWFIPLLSYKLQLYDYEQVFFDALTIELLIFTFFY